MVRMPLRYSYPRSSSVLRPSASTLALAAGVLAAVLTVVNVAVTIRAVTRLDQLLPLAHTYSTPSLPLPLLHLSYIAYLHHTDTEPQATWGTTAPGQHPSPPRPSRSHSRTSTHASGCATMTTGGRSSQQTAACAPAGHPATARSSSR